MSSPSDLSTSAGMLSEPEALLFFREQFVVSTSASDGIAPKESLMGCGGIESIASMFGLMSLFRCSLHLAFIPF